VTHYLEFEDIAGFHKAVTGEDGIRDAGVIQSAAGRPQATAFGDDAYPSVWEKAAALMQSIACNHGFVDGNKRTAWVSAAVFLDINGHPLDEAYDVDAAESLVLAVATGAVRDVPVIASALVKFAH
jgi:death on curing protein